MKVAFFSNYMNHHQRPFCDVMYDILGEDFCFIATEDMSEERKSLGYFDPRNERPYVIKTYGTKDNDDIALKIGEESDVVIIGSAPEFYIEKRLKNNKLTFRYSERFFKNGYRRILDPRVFLYYFNHHFKYRKKNLYMLCASAYTARDCNFIKSYKNKTFRWGYFPTVKKYIDVEKTVLGKEPNSILWAGRLIDHKHPEAALYVAERLKKDGYKFRLDMIGGGELEEKIKTAIVEKGLEDRVSLLGSMSPDIVRKNMERSEIFLFTSDKREGWGAVLNESMNSACAVVANGEIGSVPYLIKDGENGFIYGGKDFNDLYKKVKYLLDDNKKRKETGVKAYKTLEKVWNAEVAAKRLLILIDSILNGKASPFEDGPCSYDAGV